MSLSPYLVHNDLISLFVTKKYSTVSLYPWKGCSCTAETIESQILSSADLSCSLTSTSVIVLDIVSHLLVHSTGCWCPLSPLFQPITVLDIVFRNPGWHFPCKGEHANFLTVLTSPSTAKKKKSTGLHPKTTELRLAWFVVVTSR